MKIVIYWEQTSWGGTDTFLLSLLRDWPQQKDQFLLIHNRGNKGFARIEPQLSRLPNVRCLEITSLMHNEALVDPVNAGLAGRILRGARYLLRPLLFYAMIDRLTRLLKREGTFDALLSNNGGYPAAWGCLSAILAADRAGIPVRVLVVHHAATRDAVFLGWFERLVDRAISRVASAIVCVSYATRQTLIDRRWLFADEQLHMRVIYNGINGSRTNPDVAVDLRGKIGAAEEAILIGIVGRVEPYKGHEDVILAMARVNSPQAGRIHLVVIGAGDPKELERLSRLAKVAGVSGRVSLIGYMPGEISEIICRLDLLIVATRSFEGFGLTLAEAMQVGTPVLATRVGAIPEFVDDQVGKLVPPGSPQDMADALTDFLDNHPAWELRARLAQQRIVKFSSVHMAEEYRRFLVERLACQTDMTLDAEE